MKKFLTLTLALILALSLVACGGNNNDTSADKKENNSTDSADTKEDDEKDDDAKSDDDKDDDDTSDSGDPQGNENLTPIGTAATSTFKNRDGEKHSVSICVEEIVRGEEALSFINDNMMAASSTWSAEAPKEEDQEYLVAKITYSLLDFDGGDTRAASSCYAFDESFEAYPSLIASMFYDKDNGYPHLSNMDVNVGETVTAYEIFQIRKDDPAPTMAYGCYLADLSDGLWFELY